MDANALMVEEVVQLLGGRGFAVDAEMVRADLAAGAPVDAEGRISLAGYAAWLVREMGGSGAAGSGSAASKLAG